MGAIRTRRSFAFGLKHAGGLKGRAQGTLRAVHLLLTDRLTCPRCGPGFGLILLADCLVARRVLEGALGCPNCRERYPIRDGFGDLRPPPRDPLPQPQPLPQPSGEASDDLAALLGIVEGPGNVALVGRLAAHADALAERITGAEVVAISASSARVGEHEGVSRLVSGARPPFRPGTFRALAMSGDVGALEETVRLVARGGRVVLERALVGSAERLQRSGTRILLQENDWIVGLIETG